MAREAELFPEAEPFREEESSPGAVVFVVVSIVGAVEPQDSADIPVPSSVSVPVSELLVEVDNPVHPMFSAFPNIDYYAKSANFGEGVGDESAHSSTGGHANYGLCNILSTLDLHHNRNSERCYNNPSPGRNIVNDTNRRAMDATTSHSRKTGLQQHRGQHKRLVFQAELLHPVVW